MAKETLHKDKTPWQELLKKLTAMELKIRLAVSEQRHGDFHAVFKGNGLDFDDIRSYTYGDEVRSINWKVSAKGHGTFVNTYKETREQQVALVVDQSASLGIRGGAKAECARQVAGVLALAAERQGHKVGLHSFTDHTEGWLPCKSGKEQALRIIRQLYFHQPEGRTTDLAFAFKHTMQWLRRRSLVLVVSDFISAKDYDRQLQALCHKHDVILLRISSQTELPPAGLGISPMAEVEQGRRVWVNTSSGRYRRLVAEEQQTAKRLEALAAKHRADLLHLPVEQDFVSPLVQLFNLRNKRSRA